MIDRVAFDTETESFEAGHRCPRLVCLSLARSDKDPQLFGRKTAGDILRSYLLDPEKPLIIGHNVSFDFGVLCGEDESLEGPVWQAYKDGRVRDTKIREMLLEIRSGRAIDGKTANLGDLSAKYLRIALDKGAESVRYWYGELMHVTTDKWPKEARDYATADACSTLGVFDAQQRVAEDFAPSDSTVSPDEVLQTRADWVLHLMACWGFRTDPAKCREVRAEIEEALELGRTQLIRAGLYKVKNAPAVRKGAMPEYGQDVKETQRRIAEHYKKRDLDPPLTEKGAVVRDARTLRATSEPDLVLLADTGGLAKVHGTFLPLVEQGIERPVVVRWNVLVRSGRTSSGGGEESEAGNWQNPPRKGAIRECVVPRPGKVFGGCDYSQLELCTLAQTCVSWLGYSRLAEAIRAGRDLHLDLACSTPFLCGEVPYEEAKKILKDETHPAFARVSFARQFAKIGNFGFGGGMGAETMMMHAEVQSGGKIKPSYDEARSLQFAWKNKWEEVREYFSIIADLIERDEPIVQLSGRVRRCHTFPSAANDMFQAHAADLAKSAMWHLGRACYVDIRSPLYGSRIILFLHDEFIVECDEDVAPEATDEMRRIMVREGNRWCPDVPIKAEPRLMRRWYKGAKEVRDAGGRLLSWEPPQKVAQLSAG